MMPVFLSVVKQLKKIMKPLVTEEEDGCYQYSSISFSRVSQLLAHLSVSGTLALNLCSLPLWSRGWAACLRLA